MRRQSTSFSLGSLGDLEIETPGYAFNSPVHAYSPSGIELQEMGGNMEYSNQYETSEWSERGGHRPTESLSMELIASQLKNPQQTQQYPSFEDVVNDYSYANTRIHRLSSVEEISASEGSAGVYYRPKPTPIEEQDFSPGEGMTRGFPVGESSYEDPTPGGADSQWWNDFKAFNEVSDFKETEVEQDIDDIQKNDIGDCYRCWKHKKICLPCFLFFFLLFFVCLFLIPRPLNLCVNFTFDDEHALEKVSGDEGQFDMRITNPNYIPVSLHGLEINAYYGGVDEVKEVITVTRSDYSIGAQNSLNTNNETYVFAQNSTDVVPIAALQGCSEGFRRELRYDLVTSFKGCFMPFICQSGVVLKSSYVNNCLEEDSWMCTDFNILG